MNVQKFIAVLKNELEMQTNILSDEEGRKRCSGRILGPFLLQIKFDYIILPARSIATPLAYSTNCFLTVLLKG